MRCAVFGCNSCNQKKCPSDEDKLIRFYTFPKISKFVDIWKQKCRRIDIINAATARICSKHFAPESYVRNLQHELLGINNRNTYKLKEDAVPTLDLPKASYGDAEKINIEREERVAARIRRTEIDAILKASVEKTFTNDSVNGIPNQGGPCEDVCGNCKTKDDRIAELELDLSKAVKELDELKRMRAEEKSATQDASKNLIKITHDNESMQQQLKLLFTDGQLRKMRTPKKTVNWSVDDIAGAIVLYATGARSYKMLLKKGFPYPSVRTLQRWCQKVDMTRGIINPVTHIMRNSGLNDISRACVLSFDEMKTKATYCYDKAKDTTMAPANYVQVAMIRGLFGNWKQPIFYDFDCRMTKDILVNLIRTVEETGFKIHAIVSDLGGGNRALYKDLGTSYEKPWMVNPVQEGRKIYFFADTPHLIKLLRNHFLDQGFLLSNSVDAKKAIIEKLLDLTSGELSITHKLTSNLLTVKGIERQKVKFATKLFSHTTAMALHRAATLGHLETENWMECADLIKKTNDWFDVFNVRVPETDSRERMKAYGMNMEVQNKVLFDMTELVKSMRVIGNKSLLPFQKGIIQNNAALPLLFDELKNQYGTKYVLTYRLNQDILENFFSVIRSKGGLHDHPDQLEFQYRLRSYIVGRNEGAFVSSTSVDVDDTPDIEPTFSASVLGNLKQEPGTVEEEENFLNELKEFEYDGLENLAGFICHKFNEKCLDISVVPDADTTWTWVNQLSEGGLSKPSLEFMEIVQRLEQLPKKPVGCSKGCALSG